MTNPTTHPQNDTIGIIGLGNMGSAVGANLVRVGRVVIGFDMQEAARVSAEKDGIRVAGSIAEVMADANVVLTSLPSDATVRAVWLGDGGMVTSAEHDTIAIELSTIGKDTMVEIAQQGRKAGLRVVDCAVSGSPDMARNGRLALMVGAEDADLNAARTLLDQIGTVAHVGDVGIGKVVKLVNNLMAMGNVLVAAEAFQVGVAAGVEPQRLYEVLAKGGGRSHHFVNRFPKALMGDFSPGFTIRLGEKDLQLGIELARAVGVPTPAASTVRALYAIAMAEGIADDDIVGLLQIYQRWAEANR